MNFSSSNLRTLCFGFTAAAIFLGGCAASRDNASTEVQWQGPIARLEPAKPGETAVWVDFQDITGGTTDLRPEIEASVAAKGYVMASSYDKADFVLWTTLRFFEEMDEKNSEQRRAIMGSAIVGGAIAGGVVGYNANSHSQWGATVGGGLAGAAVGAGIGYGINWAISDKGYQMILDVQLGRKVDGGVETTNTSNAGAGSVDVSATGGATKNGAVSGGAAVSEQKTGQEQKVTQSKVHFQTENRLIVTSQGRRLPKEEASASIIAKLKNAIAGTLPRAPTGSPSNPAPAAVAAPAPAAAPAK